MQSCTIIRLTVCRDLSIKQNLRAAPTPFEQANTYMYCSCSNQMDVHLWSEMEFYALFAVSAYTVG